MTPAETSAQEVSLAGLVDLHVHSSPDVRPRYGDDLQVAQDAADAGMRAILLKSHDTLTADRASIAEKVIAERAAARGAAVPALRVLGGLALNQPAGGLNPAAVESALRLGARCIWMPTHDSRNHRAYAGRVGGITILGEDGGIASPVFEIMDLIREHDAVLATGHLSAAESLLLIRAAVRRGLDRLLVTHPDTAFVHMPNDIQRELAAAGAALERCFVDTTDKPGALTTAFLAQQIREIGYATTILTTDLGQAHNPSPVTGLRAYLAALTAEGLSPKELHHMAGTLPAALIGLGESVA